MKRFLFIGMIAALAFACSKDKFESVPKVKITSFGPEVVSKGELFRLTADVTDKEGDLQDSMILVQKRFTDNLLFTTDTIRYSLKDFGFPNKPSFELSLTFAYGEIIDGTILYGEQEDRDRGLTYGIILQDREKNRSSYVESDTILLKKL